MLVIFMIKQTQDCVFSTSSRFLSTLFQVHWDFNLGSQETLVTINSELTFLCYSNSQNSVIYLGSSFLLYSFYFELKWKKWNTESKSSRVYKESSNPAGKYKRGCNLTLGFMKLIAYGKQRTDFICSLQSPCGCLYWYSFADAKWQEREHWLKKKKDSVKMIEPHTIALGSHSTQGLAGPFSVSMSLSLTPVNTPWTAFTT